MSAIWKERKPAKPNDCSKTDKMPTPSILLSNEVRVQEKPFIRTILKIMTTRKSALAKAGGNRIK